MKMMIRIRYERMNDDDDDWCFFFAGEQSCCYKQDSILYSKYSDMYGGSGGRVNVVSLMKVSLVSVVMFI